MAIGAELGGPWGAIGGTLIGATFWTGEQLYDGYLNWQSQMAVFLHNLESELSKGWMPGR